MSDPLDAEVALALEREGLRVRSFASIAAIPPAASGRHVYRIELAAGRTLKARRFEDEPVAQQLVEIRRELPAGFAPVLCRHGRVLLEEWIEGETLGACPDGARLDEAAALLADLHATAHVAGRPVHERRGTQDWSAAADRGLHEILAAGEIDASSARRVRAAVARLDPGSATHGLVHSDFCGENLVVDRAGRLRVIDNERVRLAPLGFDLGRTWYRWSLPPRAWERFWNAYAARSAFRDPLDTLPFFRLVAVVKSAALRLRMDPTRAQDPLRRLRELANDLALQSSLGATAP